MKSKWSKLLFGEAKDVKDADAFHKLSLIAFLAWVGLGADGLSSSAYGPDESFRALGEHKGLAFFLALATALTVFVISYGYSRIIEQFPSGGGGYVVASKLLGPRVGVLSGAALIVDYVLTITISIASGADAIFSFLPQSFHTLKMPLVFFGLLLLVVLNIRGVKESVTALVPVFIVFLVTHVILLLAVFSTHLRNIGATTHEVHSSLLTTTKALGLMGAFQLFIRAYSMGGGTYTGIEAVSNGVAMMREPRVQTAKRTMVLMSVSLALTAGGILLAYLLANVHPQSGKTMNAVLLENVVSSWTVGGIQIGKGLVVLTLLSEGTLLFVAAQAGFLDGPRVMANMATDSWMPHRFSALSDRLSMRNGVLMMGIAAMLGLLYTKGDVSKLVVMYSINVFLTFSLSNLAMLKFWIQKRSEQAAWKKNTLAHLAGLLLCVSILVITVYEKFLEGGWLTLLITFGLVLVCFFIKKHYEQVAEALQKLDQDVPHLSSSVEPGDLQGFEMGPTQGLAEHHTTIDPDPEKPVAILLVGRYSGLGRHALLTLLKMFPKHFDGVVFLSVAVVDSDSFKGADEMAKLEERTRSHLLQYEDYARRLGMRTSSAFAVGTEVAVEIEKTACKLVERYQKALFVAGQIIFEEDSNWNRMLHNETAFMVQRRLQAQGLSMIVVPIRLSLPQKNSKNALALSSLSNG